MNDLLNIAIDAHGGMKRWKELSNAFADLKTSGAIWQMKGQPSVLRDVKVEINLHKEKVFHCPFLNADQLASFEPNRVAIETLDGTIIQESFNPRETFKGHSSDTKWDFLQLAYFSGCSLWTSFTAPFAFAMPVFKVEELYPWEEEGEVWRRLQVIYPQKIATHSKKQIFYFNNNGLMKRHDFDVDISAGVSVAQYYYDYKDFDGILVATKRKVLVRSPDGNVLPDPLIAMIELENVKFV